MIITFHIPVAEIYCAHSEMEEEKHKANREYTTILNEHMKWLQSIGTQSVLKHVKAQDVHELTGNNEFSNILYYQCTVSICVQLDTEMDKKDYSKFPFDP